MVQLKTRKKASVSALFYATINTPMSAPARPLAVLVVALASLWLPLAAGCRFDDSAVPMPSGGSGAGGRGGASTAGTGGGAIDTAPDLAPVMPTSVDPIDSAPAPAAQGMPCTAATGCASGFCTEGICCNVACKDMCHSCAVPGLLGMCVETPAGEDPRDDCPAEPTATCGRAGGCDGVGHCRLYTIGTECTPQTCAAGIESAPGHCTGPHTCGSGPTKSCAPFDCGLGRCVTACSAVAPCNPGFLCNAGRCMPGGTALYWRFDEDAGTAAADTSGLGNVGSYVGEPTLPAPSPLVPITAFANPHSRLFAPAGRPAVRLANVAAALKPANEITFTLWFSATSALPGGSDVMNLGTDLLLRLKPGDIEFAKRVSLVTGMVYGVARVSGGVTTHLDGKWHHLAGVATAAGMRLYLDGVLRGSNARGEPLVYTGADLWCGRDGGGGTGRDFTGGLDEVRIYTRALAAEEIAALAQGKP
jgi:hypothetical protein